MLWTINDSQPPLTRKMVKETQAMKEGRTYKQPNSDTFTRIVSH